MLPHLGFPELIVILFIIILIFGANRLPDIGRGIGKGIRNFKDATKDGARIENGTKEPRPVDRS
jgi:sec-independent protein translocase protein TatA